MSKPTATRDIISSISIDIHAMREKFSVVVFPRFSSYNFGASYTMKMIIATIPFSTLSWNFNSLLLRAEIRSRQNRGR